jgi:hypothetical protein
MMVGDESNGERVGCVFIGRTAASVGAPLWNLGAIVDGCGGAVAGRLGASRWSGAGRAVDSTRPGVALGVDLGVTLGATPGGALGDAGRVLTAPPGGRAGCAAVGTDGVTA